MPPKDGDGEKPPVNSTPSVIDPITGKPTSNIFTLNRPGGQPEVPSAPALGGAIEGPSVEETKPLDQQHTVSSPSGHLENTNWWALDDIMQLAASVKADTLGQIASNWAQLGAGFDDLINELAPALQAAIAEAWSGPAADAALAAVKAFSAGATNTTYDFQQMYTALTGASGNAQNFGNFFAQTIVAAAVGKGQDESAETAAARTAMHSYYVSANQQTDGAIPQLTQPTLPDGGIPSSFSSGDGTSSSSASTGGLGGGGGSAGTQSGDGQQQTKDSGDQGRQGDQSGGSGQQQSGDSSTNGTPQIPQLGGSGQQQSSPDSQAHAADFDPAAAGLDPGAGGAGGGGIGGGGGGADIGGGAGDEGPLASPTLGGAFAGTSGTSRPGAAAGSGRGSGPMGGMPGMGAGRRGGSDKDHKTAAYLYGRHNGEALLADDRAVMPAVIGADLAAPPAEDAGTDSEAEGERE